MNMMQFARQFIKNVHPIPQVVNNHVICITFNNSSMYGLFMRNLEWWRRENAKLTIIYYGNNKFVVNVIRLYVIFFHWYKKTIIINHFIN